MSAGEINKIISWFAASEGVGYNRMTKDKRKAALKRGTKKNNFLGFEYLLVSPIDPKTKHLKPGIYARFITGFGSTLDPLSARCLSRVLGRSARAGFRIVCATAHDDLAPWLIPAVIVRQPLHSEAQVL